MAARIDLTLDCANAQLLAAFWKAALSYVDEPPPAPFTTREEWLAQFDLPEDESVDDGAWLCDPDSVGPVSVFSKSLSPRRQKTGCISTSGCLDSVAPASGARGSRQSPSA